jgi:hypothetical protein
MHKLYETKYQELLGKYEAAMKEKTLVKLERDRLFTKNEGLVKNIQSLEDKLLKDDNNPVHLEQEFKPVESKRNKKGKEFSELAVEDRVNPYAV